MEYAEGKGILITKEEVEKMDTTNLIPKLLRESVKEIKFKDSGTQDREVIEFEIEYILNFLKQEKFIENTFLRSCTSETKNTIICDESSYAFIKKIINPEFKHVKKENLLKKNKCNNINHKNIIIFLPQATNLELIEISRILRKYKHVKNISYIIGILITDDVKQSKNLKSTIRFNNTEYRYNFYCCLDLPVGKVTLPTDVLKEQEITKGFVFYKNEDASKLTANQVFLTVCIILQLYRFNGKLHDNITYYDFISPQNFSRFNDPLLQLSILHSAEGRELNFQSNSQASNEMKDIILDFMKRNQNKNVGIEFIHALKNKRINLTEDDKLAIENAYPHEFEEKRRI